MKLLMLGQSGVGKTSYVASMYGALQTPVDGFSLLAARLEDDRRLLALHQDLKRGRYPSQTQLREKYQFHLRYRGQPVLGFDWTDYRGDALMESSEDSPEAGELQRDILSSEIVMAFFDSQTLCRRLPRRSVIRRMSLLICRALQQMNARTIPLILVLSKADRIHCLSELDLACLDGLFAAANANRSVCGFCIPVACGRHAYNVGIPALAALHLGLLRRMETVQRRIRAMTAERDRLARKVESPVQWLQDQIASWLDGVPTYGELARREHSRVMREIALFRRLHKPLLALRWHLTCHPGVKMFGGGFA